MFILKRHFYKELHEGQFIGQFMIQLFFGVSDVTFKSIPFMS